MYLTTTKAFLGIMGLAFGHIPSMMGTNETVPPHVLAESAGGCGNCNSDNHYEYGFGYHFFGYLVSTDMPRPRLSNVALAAKSVAKAEGASFACNVDGGCHGYSTPGYCSATHEFCQITYVKGGPDALNRAERSPTAANVRRVIALYGSNAQYNVRRKALQVLGCNQKVVLHIPMSSEQFRLIHTTV